MYQRECCRKPCFGVRDRDPFVKVQSAGVDPHRQEKQSIAHVMNSLLCIQYFGITAPGRGSG